jgi:dTDP-glucose 4,6-dehydratase
MKKNKKAKVLITGGAGFIGSEVVRAALRQGYRLVVVDSLSYAADLARLEADKGRITFYRADVSDRKEILEIMRHERPDFLLHLAAETHVDRSIEDSTPFIQTNVHGTAAFLDACRRYPVKKFVYVSTDEVYGEIKSGNFRENHPLEPNSPYSASKASADFLVGAYRRTYGIPAVIVRPSNNYGPWQYPEKLIPVMIYKALKNEPLPVYARGLNVREWLHVNDSAMGILAILKKGRVGQAYNLGSGCRKRNIDVVRTILRLLNKPESLIEYVQDRPGHDFRYSLDCSKLRREVGWRPCVSFETGIAGTVDWYKNNIYWLESKAKLLRAYWKRTYRK